MWVKIDVIIFALAIARVTAMPSKQDDEKVTPVDAVDPCQPSPCGTNAVCAVKDNVVSCACLPEYFGNPYEGCRPECVLNSDCSVNRTCIRNKCQDPCPGTCGMKAKCQVISHYPVCSCPDNYTGDPFYSCNPIKACFKNNDCSAELACINRKCLDPCNGSCGENAVCEVSSHIPSCTCPQGRTGDPFVKCTTLLSLPSSPCSPSLCGPHSQCDVEGGQAVCSCLPTYLGVPPNCRSDVCTVNTDCSSNSTCINQKCTDPCPGLCGRNAQCKVLNNNPICSCPAGTSGNPFVDCKENASCLNHTDCSYGLACVNQKCVDPCVGVCGINAACEVSNLTPICKCPEGSIGDAFLKCTFLDKVEASPLSIPKVPCCPSPCGPNSQCKPKNGLEVCTCLPTYLGYPPNCTPEANNTRLPINACSPSPCEPNCECKSINGYASCTCPSDFLGRPASCRSECVLSSDCPSTSMCIDQKCVDPCPGTCGINAICIVLKHTPTCTCPAGTTGNPFVACKAYEPEPDVAEYNSEENKLSVLID